MKIFIKLQYTILGKVSNKEEEGIFTFNVPIAENATVKIEITPKSNKVVALQEVIISDELISFLHEDEMKLPKKQLEEISKIKSDIVNAVKNVFSLLKYLFFNYELDERFISSLKSEWSLDMNEWHRLPSGVYFTVDGHISYSLNEDVTQKVQSYINLNFEPFFALRYIHKAKNDPIARDKWIDATIAAELAIKEFLIKSKPEIETLLLEMPSPPLSKLYGSVLESLGYPKSPKVKEISKGVEIRNKLVHRPNEFPIDHQAAINYVRDINTAIFHLMTLLYPNDVTIKKFYEYLLLNQN